MVSGQFASFNRENFRWVEWRHYQWACHCRFPQFAKILIAKNPTFSNSRKFSPAENSRYTVSLCSSVHPAEGFSAKLNEKLLSRKIGLVLRNNWLGSGEILERMMVKFWGIIGASLTTTVSSQGGVFIRFPRLPPYLESLAEYEASFAWLTL